MSYNVSAHYVAETNPKKRFNADVKPSVGIFSGRNAPSYWTNDSKVMMSKATGRVEYDEFNPGMSFGTMNAIDRTLARHYGFTDEELDFIINYDIKYRIGRGDNEEGDEE